MLPDETQGGNAAKRQEFLGRLRDALARAINGNPISVADAWDILREWDKATGASPVDRSTVNPIPARLSLMADRAGDASVAAYVRTLAEMEAEFGRSPDADEACPLCMSAPGEHHKDDCPWMIWAKSPRPGS